jgi:hypothetical protein
MHPLSLFEYIYVYIIWLYPKYHGILLPKEVVVLSLRYPTNGVASESAIYPDKIEYYPYWNLAITFK